MGRKAMTQKEFFDQQELLVAPGAGYEATHLVRQLGCYSTLILLPLSWASVGALMLWQGWPFVWWPFLAVPLGAWVVLLAVPMFWKMRQGVMVALDAVVRTMEAYLSRANLAVDLNQDGRVGHYSPEVKPVVTQEYRPIVMGKGLQTTHHSAPALPKPDSAMRVIGEDEPVTDRIPRKVIYLPNRERCTIEQLETFVRGIFVRGWARSDWVGEGPDRLPRKVYEGCIQFVESGSIIEDRKPGFTGRLTVDSPDLALQILGKDPERGWEQ